MTPEELMKPRYKVIADYPGMSFKIGDTLTYCKTGRDSGWYNESGQSYETCVDFPHLFKKLEWWEERNPEEMPEYVWYDESGFSEDKIMKCLKVKNWVAEPDGEIWGDVEGDKIGYATYFMTSPATETEYLSYLKTKSK